MNGIDLSKIFGGQTGGMILYFVVIIAVFYFLLIRPQKKRDREQKNLLNSLKKGDQIITIGGFYGKILSVKDDIITLQIGDNTAKIERSAVKTVVKASAAKAEIEDADEAEDDTKSE